MALALPIDLEEIADFCRTHHIRRLSFFGSVTRDDFGPDSDVDVLYEFEPGHSLGWEIADVEESLSLLLGRPVDMVPLKYINPRLRDTILAESQVAYAA